MVKLLMSKFTRKLFLKILGAYVETTETEIDNDVYKLIVKLIDKNTNVEREVKALIGRFVK